MNYAEIKYHDIANGPGIRTSLFVSGCNHHCKGCFNEEAQDFSYGKPFTKEIEDKIIESLGSGLTILGGEPMEIQNIKTLITFLERVRNAKPDISIWVYTGFTLEELLKRKDEELKITKRMIQNIDMLVDGRFVQELKSIRLQFRGSSNQRIIDIKKTFEKGEIIQWENLRR